MAKQMRSLVQRIIDSELWAEQLLKDEFEERWCPIPYSERSGLRHTIGHELESMAVEREMRVLEVLVLGESDKVREA